MKVLGKPMTTIEAKLEGEKSGARGAEGGQQEEPSVQRLGKREYQSAFFCDLAVCAVVHPRWTQTEKRRRARCGTAMAYAFVMRGFQAARLRDLAVDWGLGSCQVATSFSK